ncbi:hypothetical protein BX616_002242 [Lobosporangium transversale]|nr:hypothetical protein BX616_002242 [Lobosporangium transversale]
MTGISFKYALFITGNPGSGKSFIVNHLGAHFPSGFSGHGGGYTTGLHAERAPIDEDEVLMVDAPGLIEVNYETTVKNATLITNALNKGQSEEYGQQIPYKIGIVITDTNGRIQPADMLLVRKLYEALTPKPEFMLIINQVRKSNLHKVMSEEYQRSLITTIKDKTGVAIHPEHIVAIVDFPDGEQVDLEQLKEVLRKIDAIPVKASPITITNNEFDTILDKGQSYGSSAVNNTLQAALPSNFYGVFEGVYNLGVRMFSECQDGTSKPPNPEYVALRGTNNKETGNEEICNKPNRQVSLSPATNEASHHKRSSHPNYPAMINANIDHNKPQLAKPLDAIDAISGSVVDQASEPKDSVDDQTSEQKDSVNDQALEQKDLVDDQTPPEPKDSPFV